MRFGSHLASILSTLDDPDCDCQFRHFHNLRKWELHCVKIYCTLSHESSCKIVIYSNILASLLMCLRDTIHGIYAFQCQRWWYHANLVGTLSTCNLAKLHNQMHKSGAARQWWMFAKHQIFFSRIDAVQFTDLQVHTSVMNIVLSQTYTRWKYCFSIEVTELQLLLFSILFWHAVDAQSTVHISILMRTPRMHFSNKVELLSTWHVS